MPSLNDFNGLSVCHESFPIAFFDCGFEWVRRGLLEHLYIDLNVRQIAYAPRWLYNISIGPKRARCRDIIIYSLRTRAERVLDG